MLPTTAGERLFRRAIKEPDPGFGGAAADVAQGDALRRLGEQLPGVGLVDAEEELEVFAVGEGVMEAVLGGV